jgi:hypothetical protein
MKIYHLLFLVWLLVVTLWIFGQIGASARRKNSNAKK